MKRVKVTLMGVNGAEFSTVVPVEDDYELPIITREEWVVIEGSDGSAVMVPPERVVGIYVEAGEKETAKGGRIN